MTSKIIKPDFESIILNIRGYTVMIDADLAYQYETDTKVLKQQVKRNIERFPEDFMFQLSKDEKDKLVKNYDGYSKSKKNLCKEGKSDIIGNRKIITLIN